MDNEKAVDPEITNVRKTKEKIEGIEIRGNEKFLILKYRRE